MTYRKASFWALLTVTLLAAGVLLSAVENRMSNHISTRIGAEP